MYRTRRQFLQATGGATMTLKASGGASPGYPGGAKSPIDARSYLSQILYSRQEVDDWLAGKAFPFAKYDGELGWLLRTARFKDGLDGSVSTYTYGMYDERRMVRHADRPCRINTYGNSFTQCHQVSDGETWQEVLAAHLGEPLRNFGIGGYSVYQAYRRMRREEARVPAEYIILNIYGDDHYRNLDAWRNIRNRKHPAFIEPTLPHLRLHLETEKCTPIENPCPTQDSVYKLCDLDWVYERFRDDFVLGIMLANLNAKEGNPDRAYQDIMKLARTHGINTRLDEAPTADAASRAVHTAAALAATTRIVEWLEEYARANGKKVLYVLSFSGEIVARWIQTGERFDRPFLEFLEKRGLPYVDLLEAHARDHAQMKIPIKDYLARYYIGHYNPLGNHFTAFAIKSKLVSMLIPEPPAFRPA